MSRAPIMSGHEVVGEAEQDRDADEKDHGRPVHGHQPVEDLRRDEMVVRHGELDPHRRGLEAGDREEEDPVDDVHDPEPLVVDRRHPAVQALEQPQARVRAAGSRRTSGAGSRKTWSRSPSAASAGTRPARRASGPRASWTASARQASARRDRRTHARSCSGVLGTEPAAIVSRLIRWVRSGPYRPLPTVPRTVWQFRQAVVSKTRRPAATASPVAAAGALRGHPAIEVLSGVDVDAQEHLRVLRAAVLGALALVEPGLVRVDPGVVDLVRDQIRLARQARHPEAVGHVGGLETSGRSASGAPGR